MTTTLAFLTLVGKNLVYIPDQHHSGCGHPASPAEAFFYLFFLAPFIGFFFWVAFRAGRSLVRHGFNPSPFWIGLACLFFGSALLAALIDIIRAATRNT